MSAASDAVAAASSATFSHGGVSAAIGGAARSTSTRDIDLIDSSRCGVSMRICETRLPKASMRSLAVAGAACTSMRLRATRWPVLRARQQAQHADVDGDRRVVADSA